MDNEIERSEWFESLVDDCRAIVTEAEFTSRWSLVEGYHQLGERIVTDENLLWNARGNGATLQRVAKSIGIAERSVYYAIQFYEKFPDLSLLPLGKNASWRSVIALLTEPKTIETPELPEGKYFVIYADPAWPVGSIVMDKWESPIDDKYPTMTIDEIGALPVAEHSADDCSLFLWTTHTFLPVAFEIIEKWGFKYFCCITWNKGSGWTQNGFHKMTEFLLFAYKGKMNVDQFGKAIPTLISETKTFHSKKPDSIRDLIKSKTPEPRLEMFARQEHDGWVSWGNEVGNG